MSKYLSSSSQILYSLVGQPLGDVLISSLPLSHMAHQSLSQSLPPPDCLLCPLLSVLVARADSGLLFSHLDPDIRPFPGLILSPPVDSLHGSKRDFLKLIPRLHSPMFKSQLGHWLTTPSPERPLPNHHEVLYAPLLKYISNPSTCVELHGYHPNPGSYYFPHK